MTLIIGCGIEAKALHWSRKLNADEALCLNDLLQTGSWRNVPIGEIRKLKTAARVASVHLDGPRRRDYVYLFEATGWCGSAGCALLIGEVQNNGGCRLLYDGSGWFTFALLRRRDHRYHRIYAPCELRFGGRRYRQVREECPNLDVQH